MKVEILNLSESAVGERYYENIGGCGYNDVFELSFKINDKEYSIEVYESGIIPKQYNPKNDNGESINISSETLKIIDAMSYKYCQNLLDKRETI